MKNTVKLLMLSFWLSFSTGLSAESSMFSLGVGAVFSPAIYKDTPSNMTIWPLIGDMGEHLYLDGISANYHVWPDSSTHNIVFRLQYDARTFQPEDSSDPNMQLLDEREATILGGVGYQYKTIAGLFSTSIATDLGQAHNGLYADVSWQLPYRGRGWGFTPSIGYAYNSDRMNQHYYGVSDEESARTGGSIAPFEADWDGQYFMHLSAYLMLMPRVRLEGGVKYTQLDGDLAESPIIDSTTLVTTNIGLSYLF